jgi:MoaA/NifB/PqqE/SkfB family radical SAM enzyme
MGATSLSPNPAPATPKFRIDVAIHDLLMQNQRAPQPPEPKGMTLPDPVFPQYPELLNDPGTTNPPLRRKWGRKEIMRNVRGWLVPYIRSRVMPGDFHPMVSYLFLEYKCNLDCWYCWAYDNKIRGMSEDVARRSIDWLHDHGCRVLALMGGEPLLRPDFAHKVCYYAAKKGFWIYIATNGRLLRPEVTDRLADSGVAVFNFALDSWDNIPSLPKAFVPSQNNLEYLLRKQYAYGYMVFFNMNICRNNHDDIKRLTEYAESRRIAVDFHINETPMIEQDAHFKHLDDNPTYIRPQDWRAVDELIDWIIEKNKSGTQMVNSVKRLQEMKAFVRMSSGVDVRKFGWYGDGTATNGDVHKLLQSMPGIEQDDQGDVHFVDWNCRAGQNNVIVRTDGTVAPCFPMYASTYDWGNIDRPNFEEKQLREMKVTCERHCFSTLNHNLSYCYNDARVIKWLWQAAKRGFKGGSRSFED